MCEILSCKLLCLWIPSKKGKQPNSETKRGNNPNNLDDAIDGGLCGIGSRNNPFGLFSKNVAAFFDVGENVFLGFAYFRFLADSLQISRTTCSKCAPTF